MSDYVRAVLKNAKPGDLIEFSRFFYSHWAVYIGDGQIVHLTCERELFTDGVLSILTALFKKAVVRVDNLESVAGNAIVVINNSMDNFLTPYPGDEIVKRALRMVGDTGYGIFAKNCENVANYCRYGYPSSPQVVFGLQVVFAVGAGIVVGGLVKEAIEDIVGFKWAIAIGSTAGVATSGGVLVALMNSTMITELLEYGMMKVTEFALTGWGAAALSTIGIGIAVVAAGVLVYKILKSETFGRFARGVATGVSSIWFAFCEWIQSFAGLLFGSRQITW